MKNLLLPLLLALTACGGVASNSNKSPVIIGRVTKDALTIRIDTDQSYDPDGQIVKRDWTIQSPAVSARCAALVFLVTNNEAMVIMPFCSQDSWTATVSMTDNEDAVTTSSFNISWP